MASKEKKEKKEDKEKKEKKEKKEGDEKKDKKEKKEKTEDDKKDKKVKRKDGGDEGFDLYGETADTEGVANQFGAKPEKPQDKRDKEIKKEQQQKKDGPALISASDAIAELMEKKKQVQREEKKKEQEKQEKAAKLAKKAQEEQEEATETFQVMEKGGAGNFMSKADVLDVMKNTVSEATGAGGSRCQISASTKMGDKLFTDQTKYTFSSLGDFKTVKGFIYIRGSKDAPGCDIKLIRPSTVYVCLSKTNEDDPFLRSWEEVDTSDMFPPEFSDGVAEAVEVKKKTFKKADQADVKVPKPPKGVSTVLVFVLPDFHATAFGAKLETEEERLAREKEEAAGRRAAKETKTKADEPSAEEKIEAILAKVEKGEKLSNKEKRAYDKYQESKGQKFANDDDAPTGSLGAFSISLEGGKNDPPAESDSFVCKNFTISAPGQTLFDSADITITQGKRYGILGPNGMGKTTVLRHIAAREMPVPLNWDVILVEQEAKATERTAVEEVLAADFKTAELLKREEDLIKKMEEYENLMTEGKVEVSVEELEKTRLELETTSADLMASGADAAEAQVRKILCGLGFTAKPPDEDRFSMDRPVVQFSGGWRMRISLAKALFLCPKLLLLDEPTNHLDLDAVLWLDEYLSEHYPHAVIVVSHDADFLDSICTDVLHLENKKLIHYRGDYTAFKKMHDQKKLEQDREYKKQQDEIKMLKKKGKTNDQAVDQVKQKYGIDMLDDLPSKRKDYVVNFRFIGHGTDRTLGVNVSGVAFSYDGKQPYLLEDCEIGVDCGSRIAMVGPNGAGKSTLLNLIMEHLEPCEGEVRTDKGIRVRQYHQHFEELLPLEKTGVEYLQDAFNLSPPEKARATLGQFGLPGATHFTKIGNLSGGQKARVAFAALMLHHPHIIILDEPTNHLDIESVEALTDAVSQFNGGLVIVTHDARLIQAIDCELWVVEDGTCYRFEKGFDGYRDKVLDQLEKRQEEVERMEQKRREEREKKRLQMVGEQKLKAAQERKEKEEASKKEGKPAKEERENAKDKKDKKGKEEKKPAKDQETDEDEEDEEKSAKKEVKPTKKDEKPARGDKKTSSGGMHPEFKVAEVAGIKAIKKKKGFFVVELDVGEDDNIKVVTNLKNVVAGSKVIVAPEGTKVLGEEVEESEIHGETSQGVLCGPKEMGWSGDDSEVITLKDKCKSGSAAPADEKSPLIENDEDEEEEEEEEETKQDEGKHPEFKAAEVAGIKAIKKKKGFFLVELDVGKDDNIKVVTNLKNVVAGSKVIVAPEGTKVLGEKVEESEIHGETSQGVLCGPKEMGWSGDASEVITLKDECEPGSAAPADEKDPLVEKDEDEEDEGEEQEKPPPKKGTAASKEDEDAEAEARAEGKRQVAEGEKQKKEAEAEAKRHKAEEEKKRKQEERDAKKRAAEEEERRIEEEAEAKRKEAAAEAEATDAADADGKGEEKHEDKEDDEDIDAVHDEYKVAEVVSKRELKKKKGFFVCEVNIGEDETVPVVTNLKGIQANSKVIYAPIGSTVLGQTVEEGYVHSEMSQGVICGRKELGWVGGDPTVCVSLVESCEVGEAAPASRKSPLVMGATAAEGGDEEADEDEDEPSKGGKDKMPKKGGGQQSAKPGRSKKGDDEDEEEDDNDKKKGSKPAAKSKAKAKKGKADDEDDEDDAAASKAKGKKNKDQDEEEEEEDDKHAGKKKPAKMVHKPQAVSKSAAKKASAAAKEEDDDEPRKAAKGKKGRKRGDDSDDDEEEDEERGKKPAAKAKAASAKAKGKKGKAGKNQHEEDDDDPEEEEENEDEAGGNEEAEDDDDEDNRRGGKKQPVAKAKAKAPAAKARGKKGKAGKKDDDDDDEAADDVKAKAAPTATVDGKHPQYIVAKVLSADPMKKKKGSVLCELQTGNDTVTAVTSYENVEAGNKVILAPEGSEVNGKEIKRSKVAGEWTTGVICGPMEMGWPGDASMAIILSDSLKVGDAAPAGPGGSGDAGADDEEEEEERQAPVPKKAAAKKASAFAAFESDEEGSDEEGDDDEDDEDRRKKDKKAAKATDKEKKSKKKKDDSDDEPDDDDSDDGRGKKSKDKKGKKK